LAASQFEFDTVQLTNLTAVSELNLYEQKSRNAAGAHARYCCVANLG
jgi:hypothetical protein